MSQTSIHRETRDSLSNSLMTLLKEKGYTLANVIGRGACGKVFYTEYKEEGQEVTKMACKVINTATLPLVVSNKFLPRELEILSKLSHPNIIHIFSIFRHGEQYIILMRFAEMGDLLDYILYYGEVQEIIMRSWFFQLAAAIQYLHALDIAHRDIKCENVLITSRYNIKLADFGFSRFVIDARGKNVTSRTFCGSPAYVAPEILKGRPYFPKLSDTWSMGVLLYVALNRCLPFTESEPKKLMKKQMNRDWRFRTRIEQNLTKEAIQLVRKLLEPDYKRRLTSDKIMEDNWFIINGTPFQLTEQEKKALSEAKSFKQNISPKRKLNSLVEYDELFLAKENPVSFMFSKYTNYITSNEDEKNKAVDEPAVALPKTESHHSKEITNRNELKANSATAIATAVSSTTLPVESAASENN